MSRRLVLLGGSAGSGKSTAARALAARLGAAWLQLDTLWTAMREAAPTGSEQRSVLDVDAHLRSSSEPVQSLLERHVAASAAVCAALPGALASELDAHAVVVADGAWVLPGWAAGLRLAGTEVRAVFLHEADPDRLGRALASRRSVPVAGWHATSARLAVAYGSWLADQAAALGLPLVESRPYATVVDRLLEATGQRDEPTPSGDGVRGAADGTPAEPS